MSVGADYAATGTPVPAATNPTPTTAQLRRERVAGNTQIWLWKYLQALTPYIDEVELQFGDDIYKRMLFDPAVKAAIDNLKRAVLAPGAQIVPAVEADHPRYAQAKEAADFCRSSLESLQRPTFLGVVWALLDAVAFGNKVAEIVLEPAAEGEYAGKLVLRKLKVRPKRAMAFVVDAYANCVGVLALSPGMGATFGLMAPLNLVNPERQPNFIPRDKFLFLTHDPLNEDPRGSSALRAAYDWWWKKQQMGGEWLKHGARFGSPSVVGRLTAAAQGTPLLDGTGQPYLDSTTGQLAVSSPAQDMAAGLETVQNGGVLVILNDEEVFVLEPKGEGQFFTHALTLADLQIEKGITGQTLSTSEGQHQARAAAETHGDTKAMAAGHIRVEVEQAVRGDLLSLLVRLNYGPGYSDVVPILSIAEAEQQDLPKLWTAVGALQTSGFITPSMQQKLAAQVDLPKPSDAEVKAAQEQAQTEQDAAKKALEAPAQQPGAKPQPAGAGAK